MTPLLSIAQGINYLLTSVLAGGVVFWFFILDKKSKTESSTERKFSSLFQWLLVLTTLSSTGITILCCREMSDSWAFEDIWIALSATSFGHVACIRIVALLFASIFFKRLWSSRISSFILLILLAALPFAWVVTGHAGVSESLRIVRVGIDWIHSLAVGVWTGGLLALYIWLGILVSKNLKNSKEAYCVVKRFSHFAMASTGVIFITGMSMAYFNGIFSKYPWSTSYGVLVISKIFIFSGTLGVAALNQFIHLRKWNPNMDTGPLRELRREISIEIVLVAVVFALAGFLARSALP